MNQGKLRPFVGQKLREYRTHLSPVPSLGEVSRRLTMSTSAYISDIELGKRAITDEKLLDILMRGYQLPEADARHLAGRWVIEEKCRYFGIAVTFPDEPARP